MASSERPLTTATRPWRLIPDLPKRTALAHARVFTREYDKVIADCGKALELNPKLAEAYNHRASAWVEKGKYDKALADCNKAISLDPQLAEAYLNRGLQWGHRGDEDKAIADYKHALAITPDDWRALNDLGVSFDPIRKAGRKSGRRGSCRRLGSGQGMPPKVGDVERGRQDAMEARYHRTSHGDRHSQQPRLCLFGG